MTTQRHNRRRGGFTLVEVAIATAVIGIGITAMIASLRAGTSANYSSNKIATATLLAQGVREWTLNLPFKDPDLADANKPPGSDGTNPQTFVDDLDDLMNVTYSPPRDGSGQPIASKVGWSQTIRLTWRNPKNLQQVLDPGTTDVVNVEVEIRYANKHVLTTQYLVAKRNP